MLGCINQRHALSCQALFHLADQAGRSFLPLCCNIPSSVGLNRLLNVTMKLDHPHGPQIPSALLCVLSSHHLPFSKLWSMQSNSLSSVALRYTPIISCFRGTWLDLVYVHYRPFSHRSPQIPTGDDPVLPGSGPGVRPYFAWEDVLLVLCTPRGLELYRWLSPDCDVSWEKGRHLS